MGVAEFVKIPQCRRAVNRRNSYEFRYRHLTDHLGFAAGRSAFAGPVAAGLISLANSPSISAT